MAITIGGLSTGAQAYVRRLSLAIVQALRRGRMESFRLRRRTRYRFRKRLANLCADFGRSFVSTVSVLRDALRYVQFRSARHVVVDLLERLRRLAKLHERFNRRDDGGSEIYAVLETRLFEYISTFVAFITAQLLLHARLLLIFDRKQLVALKLCSLTNGVDDDRELTKILTNVEIS